MKINYKLVSKVASILMLTGFSLSAHAQVEENENVKAQKAIDAKGYFGYISYKSDALHTHNINYSITPKVPTDKVTVQLYTPESRPLSFAITNQSGKVLKSWKPTEEGSYRNFEISVSDLKAGKYIYTIYWADNVAKEISFEKK